MDVIRLRTLTMKSTLWFGKYEGMTIFQIISLNHTRYLRWIYFHNEIVNFTEDVLEAIHLRFEKDRIEKPGRDPEKFKKQSNRITAATDDFKVLKTLSRSRKDRKMDLIRKRNDSKYAHTKKYYQRKNQGHNMR